jgi:hypothetical protein
MRARLVAETVSQGERSIAQSQPSADHAAARGASGGPFQELAELLGDGLTYLPTSSMVAFNSA